MRRITIALTDGECSALLSLAERERRDPRAQAAVLIRDELERCGLLREATAIEPQQSAVASGPRID